MVGVQDGGHMAGETSFHLKKIAKSSLIDSFSTLESNEESCRVNGGIALLRCLYQKQHASENEVPCPEINYSLKRLIRGLATSNANKRAGFFSVFVEILKLFPCITLQNVLDILENEMKSGCNTSRKEMTEVYSCQTLVFGALIHSNFIFKEPQSAQVDVFSKLLAVSEKKKILFSYSCSFIIDYIQKIEAEHFQKALWPLLKPELSKSWEEHSLDSIYVLLKVKKRFPDMINKKFLVQTLGSKDIINRSSMSSCSKMLLKPPIIENHPVYEEVSSYVCTSNLAIPFWESLVIENQQHPNQQKEEVLLNFLEFLLQYMPNKSQIPELLLDNFMGTVIKTFQVKKFRAKLSQKASEIFTKMSSLLKSNEIPDEVRILFIQRILFYPGNLMFDKLAGTKIVIDLSSHMKAEEIERIAQALRDVISAHKPKMKNETETCVWNKQERIYAAQLFTRFLSLPVMEENIKWKLMQLKFLISFGLMASPSREPGEIVNAAVSVEVRNCLFKALEQKVSKEDQLVKLLTSVAYHLNEVLFDQENPLKLRQPLSDSSIAAWQNMILVVKEIENAEEKAMIGKHSKKHMFLILFLHMGLQLFHNASLAKDALQELHACYEKTSNTNVKSGNKKGRNENVEEDEPHWVEVIVDLLLSLLSHSSHMLRYIVGVIFPNLCPHLTPSSVHQILQVLDPLGKQPLSSTDTEGDDSEDDANKKSSDDDSERESGDDDDDEDLDDDTGNAPVDVHLKMAVHNALKIAGGGCSGSDEESIDMDQMTKEERNGLDAALSEAFKLLKHNQADQKRSHKKQSKNDETLMHFRVRVLDLLDSYLANEPALAVVLDMTLPLFELLEFCIKDSHQKPLENRVRVCLKKLSNVKHFSNVLGVDQELISVVLRRLLQKGERAAAVYQNMGGPLVQCSTFLARTSHYVGQQSTDSSVDKHSSVEAIFQEALNTFFQQRDSLLPLEVFKSILIIPWRGSWMLAEEILNFAFDTGVRPYRRHQALQLLVTFFSNGKLIANASPKNLKKMKVMEELLSENTVNILQKIAKEKNSGSTAEVKEIFIKELLRVLFAVWHAHNRCGKDKSATAVDWDAVGAGVSWYWDEMSLATDTKMALKKLANVLQISLSKKNVIPMKRKASKKLGQIDERADNQESDVKENGDVAQNIEFKDGEKSSSDTGDIGYESGNDENDDLHETNKKRKRPNTNNLKGKAILKKQMKEARLAAMAEGLDGSFSFAKVDVSKFKDSNNGKETVLNVKKKKKHSLIVNGNNKCSDNPQLPKKSKVKRKNNGHTYPKQKKRKVSE